MSVRTNKTVEFGDFQTPYTLARRVCELLRRLEVLPKSIVEPTCGRGSFLRAATATFPECATTLGFDINPKYVQVANTVAGVEVHCEDFFEKDWARTLSSLPDPILVLGNPPWVTNSAMGVLGGENLPAKSNFQRLSGLDAITGKSNFDISEWMLVRLLKLLSGREAVLAMLCKTTVARKTLNHAWRMNLQVATSSVYSVDAHKHFEASVDACLLVCKLKPGVSSRESASYQSLEASAPNSIFALRDGQLVADLGAFKTYGHLGGQFPRKWRSGVKHDCSRVMELRPIARDYFKNGLGEVVRLESTHLYPMLKSSDLTKLHPNPSRFMLVTQRSTADDTSSIKREAPRTWDYLLSHSEQLDRRASSIYSKRPRFSIFGVGPYSFAPWKVATSGLYKRLDFRCIGPVEGKPVMLDDTCYFLPCQTEHDAKVLADLLNSEAARGFFRSFIFWDAKRPITIQLLASLDLGMLAKEAGMPLPAWTDEQISQVRPPTARSGAESVQLPLPSSDSS